MNRLYRILIITAAVILLFSVPACADVKYPSHTGEFFVNDFANVIGPETEQKIVSLGRQLEEKTTSQVVLATIDTLDGQDIESYSIGLATKWEIGQKGKDNGVLILYANKERMLRIEVGYGLEGALPDLKTAQIREQYVKPYTKNNDFDSGLLYGYTAIVNEVAKEYNVSIDAQKLPEPDDGLSRGKLGRNVKFFPVLIIIFLVFDGIFFRFRLTSALIQLLFWSSFFRGGRGGWGGGSGGGFGGGGFGGGSSGGGGSFGGGGSSGSV